ncbi:MAG: hypothetical protein QM764_08825 [Chitinophagaceae bacterium]
MQNDNQQISVRIAKLILGFFSSNLTNREQKELDLWVGNSDKNLKLFEEFAHIRNRPIDPAEHPELNEEAVTTWNMVGLIVKYLKKEINPKEQKQLDKWLNSSKKNREIFDSMPKTSDMKIVFEWLADKYIKDLNKPNLN